MASKLDFIQSTLTKNLIWSTDEVDLLKRPSEVFQDEQCIDWIDEFLEDLKFKGEAYPGEMQVPQLQIEDSYLVFYDATSFNRYKNYSLRSELYDNYHKVPLQHYRSFCRSNEVQCVASSSAGKLWTNQLAESYFGNSEKAGDLGPKGSAAWKLKAFREFLFDLYAFKKKLKVVYISIYDVIMVKNKLITLDELLLSQNPESEKYLWNYLKRLLQR